MITDCQGYNFPIFASGNVLDCFPVENAIPKNSVYELKVEIPFDSTKVQNQPQDSLAGQFYMLHAQKSDVLLSRPISVYNSQKKDNGNIEVSFLILVKGKGTQELCSLKKDDKINLLGPCGNRFPCPDFSKNSQKICIIGGGIGVAPVVGFAQTLPNNSYDFFASFKSGSYGLENIHPEKLTITTDDGSVGIKGMLPVAFSQSTIKEENYSCVYACGPLPMLEYIQKVCKSANVKCFLSMESRMACGVGVCLGCVIDTTEGKKRCCKEGPVFDANILIFNKSDEVGGIKIQPRRNSLTKNSDIDLSVKIKNVTLQNPVIASSGTFGFGVEYATVFNVNRLGGISSKGLTLEPRQGNDGIRIHETPSGLMNSIGLQNPGILHFIENELPMMMSLKPITIANLSGSSLETYVEGAKLLDKTNVPLIELNISCPNVSAGGAAFGMTCTDAKSVVKSVRNVTTKPLIVKLTPQSHELEKVALTCIEEGADAISLCNSFQGIAIDIERGVPVFDKIKAGFGGPAVRPIAVRLVYEVCQAIKNLPKEKQVPVIAIGGIATWQDAVEFIMAGANAIQVGTYTFSNPNAMNEIIDGLTEFMKRKGYKNIEQMRGLIL